MERLLSCAGCLVLRQPKYFDIQSSRYFHVISVKLKQNHYQVLGVNHKATSKEIRTAFVKRTKEVHPDRNPDDPENHDKFVRVHKAYSILSKPQSRHMYDHSLVHRAHVHERMARHSHKDETHQQQQEDTFSQQSDYESYDYHQQFWKEYHDDIGTKPYQESGTSNIQVLGMCLILLLGGWLIFFLAMSYSKKRRVIMDRISRENHEMYEKQKAIASKYTLEERLEQVRLKTQRAKAVISGKEELQGENTTS